MQAIEKGRIGYKTKGRNAGKKIIIADSKIENNQVAIITAKGNKKANIRHLFLTEKKIEAFEKTKIKKLLR